MNQKENLFKTTYCLTCQQIKICGLLHSEYCRSCAYQNQLTKWTDYLTYEKAWSYEKQQWKTHQEYLRQLATSQDDTDQDDFSDWKKFYRQKNWGLNLTEWLRAKRILPINAACAKQWRANPNHLPENCGCLARKAKELHQSFTNRLTWDKSQLEKECQCEISKKVRVNDDYYARCENCKEIIKPASKKRVIKNRNNPKFWGLETKEKILCLTCLRDHAKQMPINKKYTFNKYLARGYN